MSSHLKIVYNPCTVPKHPAHQSMFRSNFLSCIDGFSTCPKLSLNRQIWSVSTPQAPYRAFWRGSHSQTCGLTPFDQGVCHIKGAWIQVAFPSAFANPTDRCNFGNSASRHRPGHLFSLPQKRKLIHVLNL